jgi:hypothetical protein
MRRGAYVEGMMVHFAVMGLPAPPELAEKSIVIPSQDPITVRGAPSSVVSISNSTKGGQVSIRLTLL